MPHVKHAIHYMVGFLAATAFLKYAKAGTFGTTVAGLANTVS